MLRCVPMKGGSFSISTFSVITKRLLLCFLGGFPTIGMVSFGPVRRRVSVFARGGVTDPSRECLSMVAGSGAASGLTTTMGGAGAARSGAAYPRGGTLDPAGFRETGREELDEPLTAGAA